MATDVPVYSSAFSAEEDPLSEGGNWTAHSWHTNQAKSTSGKAKASDEYVENYGDYSPGVCNVSMLDTDLGSGSYYVQGKFYLGGDHATKALIFGCDSPDGGDYYCLYHHQLWGAALCRVSDSGNTRTGMTSGWMGVSDGDLVRVEYRRHEDNVDIIIYINGSIANIVTPKTGTGLQGGYAGIFFRKDGQLDDFECGTLTEPEPEWQTFYVNPESTGGDGTTPDTTGEHAAFASLADWHTERKRSLLAAEECERVYCDCSDGATYPDDTSISLNGEWICTAKYRLEIVARANSRASSKWSNNKYIKKVTSSGGSLNTQGANHCLIDGIQVLVVGATTEWLYGIGTYYARNNIISNCHAKYSGVTTTRATGFQGGEGSDTVWFRNCIADGFNTEGQDGYGYYYGAFNGGCGDMILQNCTAVGAHAAMVVTLGAHINAYNCGWSGCSHAWIGDPWSTVDEYNCSSSTPAFAEADNYAISNADTIWKGQGTDLSAYFTTDLLGNTRTAPWFIGAAMLADAPPPEEPPEVPPELIPGQRPPTEPGMPGPVVPDGYGANYLSQYANGAPGHWLFTFLLGGRWHCFSDSGLTVGENYWHGALKMRSTPRQDLDVYTGRASACNCTIDLHPLKTYDDPTRPDVRPIDLSDSMAEDFIGAPAYLFRWAEKTPRDAADLIINGHITEARGTWRGTLTLGVSDFTVFYSESVKLPPYICTSTLWPSADGDDADRRAPIAMGVFANVEVPNVHGGDDKHLIGHHILSVSGGRIGASSSTPSLTNTTDTDGTPVAILDYNSDTANQDTLVNGSGPGAPDDSYPGVSAGALLTNLAHQLKYVAVEVVKIPKAAINEQHFDGFGAIVQAHQNALVIPATVETDLFAAAADAMRPYCGSMFHERGLLVLKALNFSGSPRLSLRDGGLLVDGDEIGWESSRNVPGGLEVHYDLSWHTAHKRLEYLRKRIVTETEFLPFRKAKAAGSPVLTIEAPHVRDAATVELLVQNLKTLYGKMRRTFPVKVTREGCTLTLLDIVAVSSARFPSADGLGVTDKPAVVVGIEYGLNTSTLTLLEA